MPDPKVCNRIADPAARKRCLEYQGEFAQQGNTGASPPAAGPSRGMGGLGSRMPGRSPRRGRRGGGGFGGGGFGGY